MSPHSLSLSLALFYSQQFRNRWPFSVSGIRPRLSKCVIAHKSARRRNDAYLCARGTAKLNSHISSALIKHAHILRDGTLRMQVARETDPEEIRFFPPPMISSIVAHTNCIAFIKSVGVARHEFVNIIHCNFSILIRRFYIFSQRSEIIIR